MRRQLTGGVILMLLLLSAPVWAAECEYSRDISLTVDAAGADLAWIAAAAGDLEIRGNSGSSQVVVTGRACASSQGRLDDLELRAERSGDRIEVEQSFDSDGWSWFGNNYAYVDLKVDVPAGLPLRVDDGSGNVDIRGVVAIEIEDGSGNLEIHDVRGDVSVDDNSGNIVVRDVGGTLRIDDGSGSINLRGIGEVVIEDDGSGSIDISEVRGSVMVRSDGSGSITVSEIGGDFTVRDDGSGGIRHSGVSGRVDIPRKRN